MDAPRRLVALVARTARAFVPALARPDDDLATRWLTAAEVALYRTMDPRDRDHATRVARRLLEQHPAAPPTWVRAALLHDVGKGQAAYRPVERIAVHLARRWGGARIAAGGAPRGRWARAIERDRDHPAVGAQLVAAVGAEPEVVALVAGHHHPTPGDAAAAALAAADAAADAPTRDRARRRSGGA